MASNKNSSDGDDADGLGIPGPSQKKSLSGAGDLGMSNSPSDSSLSCLSSLPLSVEMINAEVPPSGLSANDDSLTEKVADLSIKVSSDVIADQQEALRNCAASASHRSQTQSDAVCAKPPQVSSSDTGKGSGTQLKNGAGPYTGLPHTHSSNPPQTSYHHPSALESGDDLVADLKSKSYTSERQHSVISHPEGELSPEEPCRDSPEAARKREVDQAYQEERYKFDHPRRGRALIFAWSRYHPGTNQPERKGAEQEAEKWKLLLSLIGFDVEVLPNQTYAQVEKRLMQVAAEDHSDADCFTCFFMTHGIQGKWFPEGHREERTDVIYATDTYMFVEDLLRPFTDEECPTLARKPKLFFFQACRGTKVSTKVTYEERMAPGQHMPPQALEHEETSPEEWTKLDVDAALTRKPDNWEPQSYVCLNHPCYKDFLVAHATLPGYYAFRKDSGSWFMLHLWEQMKDSCNDLELMEIMERVNLVIAETRAANTQFSDDPNVRRLHGKGQMPWIMSMLTKEVYLKPKNPQNAADIKKLDWKTIV